MKLDVIHILENNRLKSEINNVLTDYIHTAGYASFHILLVSHCRSNIKTLNLKYPLTVILKKINLLLLNSLNVTSKQFS